MTTSPLSSLRDIGGIVGSFVIDESGTVVDRDLPGLFGDDVLTDAGERLERIFDALDDAEWAVARFSEHHLFLRRLSDGTLCVLAGLDANLPALRMAANLVAKRLSQRPLEEPISRPTIPSAGVAVSPRPSVAEAPLPPLLREEEPVSVEPDSPSPRRAPSMSPEARAQQAAKSGAAPRTRIFRGRRYQV